MLRHADEAGRVVAIATRSRALAARARQAGIPVAPRPNRVRWDAPGRYVVALGPLALALPPVGRYIQVLVIVLVAAVALLLALFLAPSGRVTVYPPTETLADTVTVRVSHDLAVPDFANRVLPGTEVAASRTYTLAAPSTGTVQVGVGYARVALTATNPTAADVVVNAGTTVLGGPEFLAFAIEETVTVPRGGSATLSAVAKEPGDRYNLPAGAITGWFEERYRFLQLTNPEPASGGTSEPRPSPSAADLAALRQLAANLETADAIRAEIIASRPHDAVLLPTARVTLELGDPRPPIGTPSPVLLLDVTVRVTALAVEAPVLEAFARSLLAGDAPGAFIPGTVAAAETGARRYDPDADEITTELRLSGEFARGLTSDEIAGAVRGRRPSSAESILRDRYGIQEADVQVTPGWAPYLPWFRFRLEIALRTRDAAPASTPTTPAQRTE
ncbi:baseplate J/gp47 family protein [Tepidiforma sp.]|uniref:baseplate J/gp47 family protein n=1 Tax=Tepidiforma sp. TaxID=2682230 RepID=UPI002ADD5F52|nr:baseplate J/gp47 family protein [Tepidiforma sp.]